MGTLIGSASVRVERFLAGATLKVASGKLEGKEFILDKPRLTIGRDERCDIPIYYDRQIEPRHATLEWTGAGYRIAPIGSATVIVNGQTVPVKELSHNDVVQVGNTRLIYRLRAGSSAVYLCSACYAPNRKDFASLFRHQLRFGAMDGTIQPKPCCRRHTDTAVS
jgi:predicted component of type VI protein secretion system